MKKIVRNVKADYIILIIAIIFTLVFIINFFDVLVDNNSPEWGPVFLMFLFSSVSWLISYVNRKRQVMIYTFSGTYIEMFDGRPSKEEVEMFLSDLKSAINEYLVRKYGSPDKDLPIEPQLANLVWLKDRDVLNEDDFERLKNQLLGRGEEKNQIGFK